MSDIFVFKCHLANILFRHSMNVSRSAFRVCIWCCVTVLNWFWIAQKIACLHRCVAKTRKRWIRGRYISTSGLELSMTDSFQITNNTARQYNCKKLKWGLFASAVLTEYMSSLHWHLIMGLFASHWSCPKSIASVIVARGSLDVAVYGL